MQKHYGYFDTLVIRNPAFTINKCLRKDTNALIEKHMEDMYFRNSILLASSDFYNQLVRYTNGEIKLEKTKQKIERSFLKYLTRMSTRCTPFGLFSTLSTTQINESGTAPVTCNAIQQSIRLDMSVLESMASLLATEFQDHLLYSVNSSLYTRAESYKFIKFSTVSRRRIYESISLDKEDYMDLLYANKNKELSIQEWIEHFSTLEELYSAAEIRSFLGELIEARILISHVDIQISGDNYQDKIIKAIDAIVTAVGYEEQKLTEIKAVINKVKDSTKDTDLALLRQEITPIFLRHGINYNENNVFHANAYRSQPKLGILNKEVIKDVLKGLEVLSYFTLKIENEKLNKFKDLFSETYGGTFVDLTQVLDPYDGIGYPVNQSKINESNLLLQELTQPRKSGSEWTTQKFHSHHHRFWFKKYIDCISKGQTEIEISDSDLAGFKSNSAEMPNTFSCSFSLLENQKINDLPTKKTLIKFNGSGGNCALNYLARFTFDNKAIADLCDEIVQSEKDCSNDSGIIAEICHIPDAKIGDILIHKRFWDYELPYLVNSSLPASSIINLEDIVIGIQGKEVVLYSKSLRKRVLPILSNAHNFRLSEHATYNFLGDVQRDRFINGPHIDFGWWANEVEFFPQIRYKNMIFVPRSWTVSKKFLLEHSSDTSPKKRFKQITPSIAERFLVGEGDNELFVDSSIESHWNLFIDYLDKQSSDKVIIKEFLYGDSSSYSNEIILSLFKKS